MEKKIDKPITRRDMLKLTAMATAAGIGMTYLPSYALAASKETIRADRTLILIHLMGGNDPLNTFVPLSADDYSIYSSVRPRIGLDPQTLLAKNANFGFNPALEPLMSSWDDGKGDLALGFGLGYAGPGSTNNSIQLMVDSHFSGSDMWDTANTSSDAPPPDGWITKVLQYASPAKDYDRGQPVATAGIIGNVPPGPVRSNPTNICVNTDIDLHNMNLNNPIPLRTSTYSTLYGVQQEIDKASISIDQFDTVQFPTNWDDKSPLAKQFFYLSQLISGNAKAGNETIPGLQIPVYVMNVSSYDTHINQVARQTALLQDLAESLAEFRAEMIKNKLWDNVMISTYAEFGRSVNENSAQGTDHGQSSTHFILGGKVRGGVYGGQRPLRSVMKVGPSMLLPYVVDFRYLYATFIQDWLGLTTNVTNYALGPDPTTGGSFGSLGYFKNLIKP